MNVDIFLDPLADQEPIEELWTSMPDAQLRRRALARRQLEVQRELKELEANLYDVLGEDEAAYLRQCKVH